MKPLLAIEWDRHEVRYVLATRQGGEVRIRAVHSELLPQTDEPLSVEPGETLKKALTGQGHRRAVTLVGVDRSRVELMHFTLPPARDSELPALVYNEVLRESPAAVGESVLDFVPLGDDPSRVREVAAAVLPHQQLEQIQKTCAAAGIKPDRMPLRSHAAVSLFSRAVSAPERVCLLVAPVRDEVDLTVLHEGKSVLSRTVRLPGPIGQEPADQQLLTEIKRTLAVAAQGELRDDPVQRIYVFGRSRETEGLPERIGRELELPVQALDPFELVDARRIPLPDRPERFASLLGMVLDESHGRAHAADFLHPRKPPKSLDHRRATALVGAAAVVLVLLGVYLAWQPLAAARADNDKLLDRLKQLDEGPIAQALKQRELMAAIRQWESSGVNWLEELRELSLRFPPERDVVVMQMSMNALPGGGGDVAFQGLVRDSSVVRRIENNLRDQYHRLNSRSVHEGSYTEQYARRFEARMYVEKRSKQQYAQGQPSEQTTTPDPPE